MSLTWEIFNYMFSSSCTIILFQVITANEDTVLSPETVLLARTPSLHQRVLQDMHHLLACQACAPPTLWTSLAASNPEKPWNSISLDFIEKLPMSSSHDSILVVVDRLSKQALFILTHVMITSDQLVQWFVIHIFSKHGVPSHVTLDQGSEFISHFFQSLGLALDMKLHFTLGYHPEGDGQTKRTNQTLEQYL